MLSGFIIHNYQGVGEFDFEINFNFGDGHGYADQDGDGSGAGWNDDYGCGSNGFNGDGELHRTELIL